MIKKIVIILVVLFGVSCSSVINTARYNQNKAGEYYKFDTLSIKINNSEIKYNFLEKLKTYLNTPYKYGGTNFRGIDCSGLTQNIFMESFGVKLPRSAEEQFKKGVFVKDERMLADLVFFETEGPGIASHVGIYLTDGYFVHASVSNGVTIAKMNYDYFSKRYLGTKRIIGIK